MKHAFKQQTQQFSSIMKQQSQPTHNTYTTLCDSAEFNSERIFNQMHRSYALSRQQQMGFNPNDQTPRNFAINYTSPAQIERMKHYAAFKV